MRAEPSGEEQRGTNPHTETVKTTARKMGRYSPSKGQLMKTLLAYWGDSISARHEANDGVLVLLQPRLVGGWIVLLHISDLPDGIADLLFRHTGPQILRADDWPIALGRKLGWHGGNIREGSGFVTGFDGSDSERHVNRREECHLSPAQIAIVAHQYGLQNDPKAPFPALLNRHKHHPALPGGAISSSVWIWFRPEQAFAIAGQ